MLHGHEVEFEFFVLGQGTDLVVEGLQRDGVLVEHHAQGVEGALSSRLRGLRLGSWSMMCEFSDYESLLIRLCVINSWIELIHKQLTYNSLLDYMASLLRHKP